MSQEADSRDSVMQNKMSFCNFQRRRQRWSTKWWQKRNECWEAEQR